MNDFYNNLEKLNFSYAQAKNNIDTIFSAYINIDSTCSLFSFDYTIDKSFFVLSNQILRETTSPEFNCVSNILKLNETRNSGEFREEEMRNIPFPSFLINNSNKDILESLSNKDIKIREGGDRSLKKSSTTTNNKIGLNNNILDTNTNKTLNSNILDNNKEGLYLLNKQATIIKNQKIIVYSNILNRLISNNNRIKVSLNEFLNKKRSNNINNAYKDINNIKNNDRNSISNDNVANFNNKSTTKCNIIDTLALEAKYDVKEKENNFNIVESTQKQVVSAHLHNNVNNSNYNIEVNDDNNNKNKDTSETKCISVYSKIKTSNDVENMISNDKVGNSLHCNKLKLKSDFFKIKKSMNKNKNNKYNREMESYNTKKSLIPKFKVLQNSSNSSTYPNIITQFSNITKKIPFVPNLPFDIPKITKKPFPKLCYRSDCLRKRIKTFFNNFIFNTLSNLVKSSNGVFFLKLPKCLIINIKPDLNNQILSMNVHQLYSLKIKDPREDNRVNHNIRMMNTIKSNEECAVVINKKVYVLFIEYLLSEDYKRDIKYLYIKEGEEYIKLFHEQMMTFLNFYRVELKESDFIISNYNETNCFKNTSNYGYKEIIDLVDIIKENSIIDLEDGSLISKIITDVLSSSK